MRCFLVSLLLLVALVSCTKDEGTPNTPPVIPDLITGTINEIYVTPLDTLTPDKGVFTILMGGTLYKVQFNATDSAQSNAVLYFATDSILTDDSREYTNLGRDALAYFPVADNEIEVLYKDGRKIVGQFAAAATTFGGTFGEQVITQWRDPNDPAKPTQKAKEAIRNFVHRYADKDGPGPGNAPTYLSVTVSIP